MTLYDPDLIAAIRQARASLYEAQAARRRTFLLSGHLPPSLPRGVSDVQAARQDLDAARALARDTATQGEPDADV